jgi:hypothetical protein
MAQIGVIIPLSLSQKLSIVDVKKGGASRVRSESERTNNCALLIMVRRKTLRTLHRM